MENLIKIVVVGGGPAGLSVILAMQQWEKRDKLQITLLEPSDWHDYQSSWVMYSTNSIGKNPLRRHIAQILSPDQINWVNESAGEFHPDRNFVLTETGTQLDYDYLILACGLIADWDSIKGLHGKLGRDGITSILSYPTLDWTKKEFRSFEKGRAVFTHPGSVSNSDGPALEMAFLMRSKLDLDTPSSETSVMYYSGSDELFPVTKCGHVLSQYFKKKNIQYHLGKKLIEVRPKNREAIFMDIEKNTVLVEKYDFLHITPSLRSPLSVARSPLSDSSGLAEVDPHTLQHTRYTNVFALGDISNVPIVRNASAIRYQMPVVVSNIAASILGRPERKRFDGSTHHMILTSEDQGVWFKLKFLELKNSPLLRKNLTEGASVARFKKRLSPLIYWRFLVAGKRFPGFFPQSHLTDF